MERLLLCATIFLFTNQLLHVTAEQSYPVRLTGGSNVYGGLVEVLYNSTWRTVCAPNWGIDEALVTCRQLGINSTAAEPTFNNLVVNNTDSNAVTISCTDSEYIALEDCNVIFTTSCGSDRIEVQCSSPPQRPSFNDPSFDTTGTTATIRWTISTAGNSQPAANYQVICSSVNAPHNITPLVSSNNIVLHGLNPCASYTCCIGGIDTNGAIGAVDCISFQTPFSPIVGSPTVEHVEPRSRSVVLQWEQLNTAERCNPPILYSVRVRVVAGQQQQQQGLCNAQQLMEFNTTNTHTIITELCPYSQYEISIKACTEDGDVCGHYSSSLSVRTLEDVPTNVNNLRCRALSPTQVNIEWQPPTQTNGVIQFYIVILNNINTTQNTTKYVENYTTTTIINHLHPNHHYSCSIAVYSAAGRNVSAIQNVVLEGSSPTGVPEEFNCSQSSSTSLQLDWREPNLLERNGPIENYSVIVWNLDTNEVVYSSFTSFTSLTIHSLVSYHNYKCAVAANGRLGLGPFDNRQVWISTPNQNFGPPSNLQVDHVTSDSFRVTWSEPSVRYNTAVRIDKYEIRVFGYQENRTISNFTFRANGLVRYEQESLHPNYCYQIEVLGATVDGVQGPTANYTVRTSENAPTDAPENFSYANVTTSSFTLTWNVPRPEQQNGDIIGYMVNVTLHNSISDEWSQVTTANVTARSFIATYLSQDTTYEATVAAMTRVGIGPPTLPVLIKTMKLAIPPVTIESDNSIIIALPVLSIVLVAIIILLILVSLRLCCRIQKIEKTYKFQGSEVIQLQDCRQVNSSTFVIENAPLAHNVITEPASCEHTEASNTYTSTEEKKIKPPAVPPKTYLEPNSDTDGEIETPSDEEAQSVDDGDNVDTCSVGSDSLYDMKLEKIGFQMPQRAASVTIESAQAIVIPPRNLPRVRAISIGSLKLSKCEQVEVVMDHETEQKNHGGSKESDYQKLDVKKMAPHQQYASLPSKRRINKEPSEGQDHASHVPGHGLESHYEPLRLKNVSKPSDHLYQELKFIRT